MAELVKLQFRPGLVICVGKEGLEVCKYLRGLLQGLDKPLVQGVGILFVDENASMQATPQAPGDTFPSYMPHDPAPLAQSIEDMLAYVQGMLHTQNVEEAGFPIPDSHPQIYIVGHKDSQTVRVVMDAVKTLIREQLDENISTPICYMLNALAAPSSPTPGATVDLSSHQLPNFIYIFRRFTDSARIAAHSEASYAAAEGLFALLATGMTADAAYKEKLAIRPGLKQFSNHLGSLSTSIVRFPRAEVRTYASARLGEDVTHDWAPGDSSISAQQFQKMVHQAHECVEAIGGWLRDTAVREGDIADRAADMGPLRYSRMERLRHFLRLGGRRHPFLHYRGPTLSVLDASPKRNQPQSPAQKQGNDRFVAWKRNTKALFQLFRANRVPEQTNDTRPWHERARDLYDLRGSGAYADWEQSAHEAWQVAGIITRLEVSQTIVRLWLSNATSGTAQARAYVEELQNHLNLLAEAMVQWRVNHREQYASDLDEFERIARGPNGPWVKALDENALTPGGPAQARPTVAGQSPSGLPGGAAIVNPANGNALGGGGPGGGGGPPLPPPLMTRPEQFIAQNLGLRAEYAESQIPSPWNIVGAVALATPPFILLALTFLPPAVLATTLALSLLSTGVIAVNAGLGWLFRFLRVSERRFSRKAFAAFYARFFAHKAENREDALRTLALGPLRRAVQQAHDALEDIRAFFNKVALGLHTTAEKAEEALFNGPATTRDVFIANGQELNQAGQNTLKELALQIDVLRNRNYPMQVIRDRLLEVLKAHESDLFSLQPEQIQTYVLEVTQTIIDEFLVGSMVELQDALKTPGLFEKVLKRARMMLYQPRSGSQDSEIFVIGRDSDRKLVRSRIPAETVEVQTRNPEWFLVAQMFRGGDETTLDLNQLLPFIPLAVPPTPGGGNGIGYQNPPPDPFGRGADPLPPFHQGMDTPAAPASPPFDGGRQFDPRSGNAAEWSPGPGYTVDPLLPPSFPPMSWQTPNPPSDAPPLPGAMLPPEYDHWNGPHPPSDTRPNQ